MPIIQPVYQDMLAKIHKRAVKMNELEIKALKWLQDQFRAFDSLESPMKHFISKHLEKAAGYVTGSYYEYNIRFLKLNLDAKFPAFLWWKLFDLWKSTCMAIASFGNFDSINHFCECNIRSTQIRLTDPEQIKNLGITENGEVKHCTPQGNALCEFLRSGYYRASFSFDQNLLNIEEGCIMSFNFPTFITELLNEENRENDVDQTDPVIILKRLHLLQEALEWKMQTPMIFPSREKPYSLDEVRKVYVDTSKQWRISEILSDSTEKGLKKKTIEDIKRFIGTLKEETLLDSLLKGPKLRSARSQQARDFVFTKIYWKIHQQVNKNKHPKQKTVIEWVKGLTAIPEHLKPSITDNLVQEVCTDVAKLIGWRNSGGAPSKKTAGSKS